MKNANAFQIDARRSFQLEGVHKLFTSDFYPFVSSFSAKGVTAKIQHGLGSYPRQSPAATDLRNEEGSNALHYWALECGPYKHTPKLVCLQFSVGDARVINIWGEDAGCGRRGMREQPAALDFHKQLCNDEFHVLAIRIFLGRPNRVSLSMATFLAEDALIPLPAQLPYDKQSVPVPGTKRPGQTGAYYTSSRVRK